MRALLFDLDGTLVDSERQCAESVARALAKLGRSVSEADRLFVIGRGWSEIYGILPARWRNVRWCSICPSNGRWCATHVSLRLRQVFSNLLTNAVKFMGPQADPHIQVGWRPASGDRAAAGLRPAPAGGEHIEFYVKDNGIGIHPDYQQRIFVPFERLKKVDVAGTGVGLSIVKRIVEGRGGRIWLESAPGAATGFFFTLPLAAAAGDEAEEVAG